MEILDGDDAGKLYPLGRGRYSELYKKLILIEVGQAIIIRYEEWKNKVTPYRTIRKVEQNYGRRFEYGRHPEGIGWLVKRLG